MLQEAGPSDQFGSKSAGMQILNPCVVASARLTVAGTVVSETVPEEEHEDQCVLPEAPVEGPLHVVPAEIGGC